MPRNECPGDNFSMGTVTGILVLKYLEIFAENFGPP